jgi:hypothetical protein
MYLDFDEEEATEEKRREEKRKLAAETRWQIPSRVHR